MIYDTHGITLIATTDSTPDMQIIDEERRMVDGAALTSEIGIDTAEIDWRKEYTNFTDEDVQHLESISHVFENISEDLVEEFY